MGFGSEQHEPTDQQPPEQVDPHAGWDTAEAEPTEQGQAETEDTGWARGVQAERRTWPLVQANFTPDRVVEVNLTDHQGVEITVTVRVPADHPRGDALVRTAEGLVFHAARNIKQEIVLEPF